MSGNLTWHETIEHIRSKPEYANLVDQAYFHEDLERNVLRFGNSREYEETKKLLGKYAGNKSPLRILDIGCGNGISAINFARDGHKVVALEPDSSDTVGAGAIHKMKTFFKLNNLDVVECFAEDMDFESDSFDVVYFRQSMHHANDLNDFVFQASKALKKNGLLLSIRDHVIFDEKDKDLFLFHHPLHKFYGGENAYTSSEYKAAFKNAGLIVEKEFKYYDSVINCFPLSIEDIEQLPSKIKLERKLGFKIKLGALANIPGLFNLYNFYLNKKLGGYLSERNVPGRMYSYVAIKK